MMMRHRQILAMVFALTLFAGACGSDAEPEAAEGSNTSSTSDADDSASSGDAGDSDSDGDAGGDENAGALPDLDDLPTELGNIPGLSDECAAIANVFLGISRVFLGGDAVAANVAAFDGLPGDLQDDAAVVVDTVNELYGGLNALGLDFSNPEQFASLTAEQAAAFGELSEGLDTPEFQAASDNLTDYAEAECDQVGPG